MSKVAFNFGLFLSRNTYLKYYAKLPVLRGTHTNLVTRALSTTPDPNSEDADAAKIQEQMKAAEAKFEEEKKKLLADIEDYKDKYKRALAEAENVRRRMQKQVGEAKQFGVQGFCKDLLEVADILNSATQSVPVDVLSSSDCSPHLKGMHEGLVMTETQLLKAFDKHGLSAISPAVGEKFDPNFHEAMFVTPAPDAAQAGGVAVVTKVGYKLHERTLRPALVGVFKS